MPSLIALVEGDGEVAAVPGLLTAVLRHLGRHGWYVGERQPAKVRSLSAFRKHLASHAGYLRIKNPGGVLVLLDLDDGCPKAEALQLADELRPHGLPFPVAVVLACREYEAWFLASLRTIAPGSADLPDDATFDGDPERPRDCKAPLTSLMPPGKRYRETEHQAEYTRLLDFDLATERSRSFRRLLHAVDELTSGGVRVTPESR